MSGVWTHLYFIEWYVHRVVYEVQNICMSVHIYEPCFVYGVLVFRGQACTRISMHMCGL